MAQQNLPKNAGRVLLVSSLAPVTLLLAFYSFVVHARIELGRWPEPMSPDPKDFSFAPTYAWTILLLVALTVFSFVPWLVTMYRHLKSAPQHSQVASSVLFSLPWVATAVVWFADPGQYVIWFLD